MSLSSSSYRPMIIYIGTARREDSPIFSRWGCYIVQSAIKPSLEQSKTSRFAIFGSSLVIILAKHSSALETPSLPPNGYNQQKYHNSPSPLSRIVKIMNSNLPRKFFHGSQYGELLARDNGIATEVGSECSGCHGCVYLCSVFAACCCLLLRVVEAGARARRERDRG